MNIVRQIQERFPIRYSIPFVSGRPLSLILQDLPESYERGIRAELDRFRIPQTEDAFGEQVTICMQPSPDTHQPCLTLCCANKRYYFCDGNPSISLIWMMYAISQNLPFLEQASECKIQACLYSVGQQTLASSLISTIDFWQSASTGNSLSGELKALLRVCVDETLEDVPRFSGRAITQQGMELIEAHNRILAKREVFKLRELSEALYGKAGFKEALNLFCHRVENTEHVFEQVDTYAEKLFRRSLSNLDLRLSEAFIELNEGLEAAEKNASKRVLEKLEHKTNSVKKIIPTELFKEVDADGEELARIKLMRETTRTLQERLQTRLEETLPTAHGCIWEWSKSLREFCKIGTACKRLDIGWDICGDIQVDKLPLEIDSWNASLLNALQIGGGTVGRYNRWAWFCGPGTASLVGEVGQGISYPLPQMSEQVVVGLMAEFVGR